MNGTLPTLILVGVYTSVGVVIAVVLAVRGHGAGTIASALIVWPFLLGLLVGGPEVEPQPERGPRADHIDTVFDRLMATLADPASDPVPWGTQACTLREALLRADLRVAFVDRVLADTDGADVLGVEALVEARRHAVSEIDAVLASVTGLRLQVGLLALAGEAEPVQAQLGQLLERADALLEVHRTGYPASHTTPKAQGGSPL